MSLHGEGNVAHFYRPLPKCCNSLKILKNISGWSSHNGYQINYTDELNYSIVNLVKHCVYLEEETKEFLKIALTLITFTPLYKSVTYINIGALFVKAYNRFGRDHEFITCRNKQSTRFVTPTRHQVVTPTCQNTHFTRIYTVMSCLLTNTHSLHSILVYLFLLLGHWRFLSLCSAIIERGVLLYLLLIRTWHIT